ncbi:Para-hydroxybenzoate--polyprenyltransferase [Gluconacetobacter sp. SXCC-1]|uniref:4-hydroxybenzoate octaprenyltransferase n=1 Tax=Komagataeibacter rhaeticus TaxID=215221 RepID=A0A181CBC1_9PROT|nr:4-hydroxybenzoate octaprenyltransferase [Komagataeibacter rhaeticus]ATU72529.1 4-hydroxybenzoate octaprenyltransferase [Komagataeibacter xylinus]EGG74880.1 Para-hydroxybenzoate--polyprenyltransferase [Gluconacetobacter sp. SXCC-1]QIP35559.1 4-hydroxybenzoate octaprenyltransferase [Komagataeibacter rhaeticus]QOC45313.1 4-hydroxybenzoate octaprenyltransferase [Komagataeibacter rhaeticus]WPP22281.1 4-hydroxybenzoate octaprenyltransferase [Komagataeibacter rhaeticus]
MDQPVPHTDIRADGWIGRLPPRLRPYALLARLDRPIGTWLLFLPGIWGILLPDHVPVRQRLFLIVLFGIGSVVMRGAGCVVNDMWDRDIDRQVARTAGRPLASGALSMREAALFLAALLLVGFNILMNLNPLSQILGASSLILVGLYPLAKRVTWWPQLVMGFTFGFGAPLGYAAAADRVDAALCALYAATIVWQLGFDTIYGFQDMEDDARIGVRSTSRLMAGHARLFVGACYALTLLGLGVAGLLARTGAGFWYLLPLPAALLGWQVSRLDERDPAGCLRLFRFNRETGLAIALTLLAGLLTR